MDVQRHSFDRWEVECLPRDGGRLSVLRFAGRDLLTAPPTRFLPPAQDLGEYETRPVYGYDDCLPSVDPGDLPEAGHAAIRDHGELCWLHWQVTRGQNRLDCLTRSELLPGLEFRRSLVFKGASLAWEFEVRNDREAAIPFLHVMHALMPPDRLVALRLPAFSRVLDEMHGQTPTLRTPERCADFLLARPKGTAAMLLLRDLKEGRVTLTRNDGIALAVGFPLKLFPTLGIWWNNRGYPDEDGRRRAECAFEPIPGTSSSLSRAYGDGVYLSALPKRSLTWQVDWEITMV